MPTRHYRARLLASWLIAMPALLPALSAGAGSDFPFNMGRLPEGDKFLEAMCGVNIESRELLIRADRWSHRLIVFLYPREKPHLWIWDPDSKSREINASPADPLAIARNWVSQISPGDVVTAASFSLPVRFKDCSPGLTADGRIVDPSTVASGRQQSAPVLP